MIEGELHWAGVRPSDKAVPCSNLLQSFPKNSTIRLNQVVGSYTRFQSQLVQIMAKLSGMSNQEETLGIASDDLGKTALCASAIFLILTVTKFLQPQIQIQQSK